MFGQSLLSGAFGSALDPGLYFNQKLYTGGDSGVIQSIGGKIKGAASFFGHPAGSYASSGSQITIPNSVWGASNSTFSFSLWFRGEYPVPGETPLIGNGGTIGGQTGFSIYTTANGNLNGTFMTSGQGMYFGNTTNIADGAWHHIVLTMNNGPYILYLDDQVHASGTSSYYINNPTPTYSSTYIGNRFNRSENGVLQGQIDQVRIYNGILTSSQVTSLYGETTATADTLDFPTSAGCVAAYTFDTDASDVSFNGTTDVATCNFPTGAGCIALYQFDDNVNDTCGTYTAAQSNITYTSGMFNKAAVFNGSSSSVEYPSMGTNFINDYSISAWFKLDAYTGSGNLATIVTTFTDAYGWVAVNTSNYKLKFSTEYLPASPWGYAIESTSTIELDTWYHMAVTKSSTTGMKMYINGTLETTQALATQDLTAGPISTYRNCWGMYGSQASNQYSHLDGEIDQGRIFNTVLTQAQVTELARGAQYNGTTRAVSYNGFLNFQPDLVWQKSYSTSGTNHLLTDSVRAAPSNLFSNDTSAATTNGMGSLDPNGFTTQTNTAMNNDGNVSGQNYVTWNWKAGAEPLVADFDYGGGGTSSSSYIPIPGAINGTNTSDLSISFWFKNTDGDRHMLASTIGDPGPGGYYSKYNIMTAPSPNGGKIRINFGNGTSQENTIYSTDNTWTDGNWHHLVYTMEWNGSYFDLKLYKDGVNDPLSTSNTSGTAVSSGNTTATIGGFYNAPQSVYYGYNSGSMSQIRYFDDVLTQTEVTALYNETPADYNTLNFPAGAGCIAAYPLNGNGDDLSGLYSSTSSFNMTYSKTGKDTVNTDGSITSTVTANQDAGFSIIKYRGVQPGSGNVSTIGHGLKNPPELIITKVVNSTNGWPTLYYKGSDKFCVRLNQTGASDANNLSLMYGNGTNAVAPTSSVYTVGNSDETNYAYDYIAYVWHSVAKYSKIGTYVGNGNTTGPTVNTGFEPAWILFKRTDATNGWSIIDSARSTSNPRTSVLQPMNSDPEYTSNSYAVDFLSNGFQIKNSDNGWNTSGGTYLYMAFAVPLTT